MNIQEVREQFAAQRAKIAAMPNEGAVLFNAASCLALSFVDGDVSKPVASGIQYARIFSDEERMGPVSVPGLDRKYEDGAKRAFLLYSMRVAKKLSLERLGVAIAALEMADV